MIRRRQPRRLVSGSVWDCLDLGNTAAAGWMRDALCAQTDPEAFFPEPGHSPRPAKQVCQECPVAADCLAYALARNERFGVWGGTSEHNRRVLRRGQAGEARVA